MENGVASKRFDASRLSPGTTALRPLLGPVKFCGRMSRFRARCCIKEYKTIPFRKKETPVGGSHPGRPGNFHPNICANHYHL
jgi:hypothetical protein